MKTPRVILLLTAVALVASCCVPKARVATDYPMFWTWMDYRPGVNFDSLCVVMASSGIDGVMLNAPTPDHYREAIPIALKHGIEVYAWLWTMNLEHDRETVVAQHPEWLDVNRLGESLVDVPAYVGYYKFMTPALDEVREYVRAKVKAYCEVEGLNGIAIDYHRLVDVILPTTLWPKYGIVQDKEYPQWDYGYHPAMIEKFKALHGYDPREQQDPSTDELWLQFRCDQVTEVANMIADEVHKHGKVMAASPFPTPAMSRKMVRQDWGKWNLDIVFPMVYHNFYTKDVSFISDCTIDNVAQKNPKTVLYCGMTATNGPEMFAQMDAALDNGAQGIAIFTVGGLRDAAVREQFKQYADAKRAERLEGKITDTADPSKLERDPFKKPTIMAKIDQSIATLTGVPQVSLGEFQLIESYGATRHYRVEEQNSKRQFDVTFYLYGDLLSGWDVSVSDL